MYKALYDGVQVGGTGGAEGRRGQQQRDAGRHGRGRWTRQAAERAVWQCSQAGVRVCSGQASPGFRVRRWFAARPATSGTVSCVARSPTSPVPPCPALTVLLTHQQVVAAKVIQGLADERIFQSFVREVRAPDGRGAGHECVGARRVAATTLVPLAARPPASPMVGAWWPFSRHSFVLRRPLPLQAAILRDMRDKNIVQFVGVCLGSEEEGQPDDAMLVRVGASRSAARACMRCYVPERACLVGMEPSGVVVGGGEGGGGGGACWGACCCPARAPLAAPLPRAASPRMPLSVRPLTPHPHHPHGDPPISSSHTLPLQIQEFMEAGSLFHALRWRDQTGHRVFGWCAAGRGRAAGRARPGAAVGARGAQCLAQQQQGRCAPDAQPALPRCISCAACPPHCAPPTPDACRYARGKRAAVDMARGLHYLHSHKVVHLDIKSSNGGWRGRGRGGGVDTERAGLLCAALINRFSFLPPPPLPAVLLARDGTAKIADVGLARSLMTKTLLSQAGTLGTFAW